MTIVISNCTAAEANLLTARLIKTATELGHPDVKILTHDLGANVLIEVLGGVAYVAAAPNYIDVTILDHDNQEDE